MQKQRPIKQDEPAQETGQAHPQATALPEIADLIKKAERALAQDQRTVFPPCPICCADDCWWPTQASADEYANAVEESGCPFFNQAQGD